MTQPTAVLFACSQNAIRSPMAEGILKSICGARIYVDSVGVHAGPPDGFAVAVMREIGIDISGHQSKTFEDLDDAYFDLVISLSAEAQHKAVEMTRVMACDVEFWRTFDPSMIEGGRETVLEAYRKVRDQLLQRIRDRFESAGSGN